MRSKEEVAVQEDQTTPFDDKLLLWDIQPLIEDSRSSVATFVNTGLTLLYWRVGQRIRQEILRNDRAEYGKQILPTLSAKLTYDYGRVMTAAEMSRMLYAQMEESAKLDKVIRKNLERMSYGK